MKSYIDIPSIVRGVWFEDGPAIIYDGRSQQVLGELPDVVLHALVNRQAARPDVLHGLSLQDIIELLHRTGEVLVDNWDQLMQPAIRAAEVAGTMSPAVLRHQFSIMPGLFGRGAIMRSIRRAMDPGLLDGWVEFEGLSDHGQKLSQRAFGARAVHIIAGNSPLIAATTIIRGVITRSDTIIKIPSTDPLTAPAILQAMAQVQGADMLLRHLSAVYWKGGDHRVEQRLLQSGYPEKLIAWGGLSTVSNAVRNMSPETEVITFNPKVSRSLVDLRGVELAQLSEAARLLARDVAYLDQEACFNTRVAYVIVPVGDVQLMINFAHMVSQEIEDLPQTICSEEAVRIDADLELELQGLDYGFDDHEVIRGRNNLIITSLGGHPVEFADRLGGRVANLVAVESAEEGLKGLDRSTQTLSVFPEQLRLQVRDRAAIRGVQRVVSAGGSSLMNEGIPHDGMEPLRRLVFWASDERVVARTQTEAEKVSLGAQ